MTTTNTGSGSESDSNRSLYKGVVVEVVFDLGKFNDEVLTEMAEKLQIGDVDRLKNAPLNSCVVRLFGAGVNPTTESFVAYPMLPPHLSLPVKPGECVWIMSPTVSKPDQADLYWFCKITANKNAEDSNYSHWPRGFVGSTTGEDVRTSDKAALAEKGTTKTRVVPGFLNDANGSEVLQEKDPDTVKKNPFDELIQNSESYKNVVIEPIPQYTKRPGDLVIQGSNNTLISLGQDRGWYATSTSQQIKSSETSSASETASEKTGTIDIVAGRARYMPATAMNANSDGDDFDRTATRIVENTRGDIEKLKNPAQLSLTRNNSGGDPDMVYDASRILASMKTSGDKNFGVGQQSIATGFETQLSDVDDSAYVVLKSDEVRIIARKQLDQELVNGSLRLIKEGEKNSDHAIIALLPDGTIQVSGNKIFIGRTLIDGGEGGGPGPGGSQPYVKYQQLEDLWNSTMDALNVFCDTLLTHTTPGFGAPSPQILSAANELKAKISANLQPDIANVKSSRIFGE